MFKKMNETFNKFVTVLILIYFINVTSYSQIQINFGAILIYIFYLISLPMVSYPLIFSLPLLLGIR